MAAGATAWLDDLPAIVASLERDWAITAGQTLSGGTDSYVAEVKATDGSPAVLKVIFPRDVPSARNEITVLRLAGGDGCVRLLRADEDRNALLLERLGGTLASSGLSVTAKREILCAAAQRMWRPVPPGTALPSGADVGAWLAGFIRRTWAELGRPCSAQAVRQALDCADRRIAAHDRTRAVLVHGDVHEWNALAAPGGGYRLVDPEGAIGEPEYDLGILMREDPEDLMAGDPRDRCRWLAQRTGRDETAIWEWGVVERMSTGLLCTQIGVQPQGRLMLAAADALAG
jgi:streptomycin 6-kinase